MLMQRLADYADRMAEAPPPMYQRQPLRYIIELRPDGQALGAPIDTLNKADKATRKGLERYAPHIKRVGTKPKLLADTGAYVFGMDEDETKQAQAAEKRAVFRALVAECAVATNEPTVRAVLQFLEATDATPYPVPADFDAKATVTFRVGDIYPIDLDSVRRFWAAKVGAADDPDAGAPVDGPDILPCVVCGRRRPALRRHPIKIKGIPNGQSSGTDLISADKRAFESYGLDNSLIAPTCQTCAEKYANALNDLIRGEFTHLRLSDVVYLFWAAAPVAFNVVGALSTDDPDEVRQLLRAPQTGQAGALGLDTVAFFALGLAASGARAVVRSWLTMTVGEARRHLQRYFAAQAMVAGDGGPSTPLPLWRLVASTVRRGGNEQPPLGVADSLVAFALHGTPLPDDVLFQAVRRCRAEQGVSRDRAMLIKLVFASHQATTERMAEMGQLDDTSRDPAYVCGRLLQILDSIQRAALGQRNATIVDKNYGAASSAPASVFGTLLHNAQNHLSAMRRNPRLGAAGFRLEQRLTEVIDLLAEFPPTLTLPEQGRFALGYYHQRAEDNRRRIAAAAARGKTITSDDDLDEAEIEAAAAPA